MYYKYRPKKKDRGFLKFLIVLIMMFFIGYLVYQYKDMLMFWKIDQNDTYIEVQQAASIEDLKEKSIALAGLEDKINKYILENSVDPDAYILASMYFFEVFLNEKGQNFSEMYVNDSFPSGKEYLVILEKIQKNIRKVQAFNGKLDSKSQMLLLQASFYSSHDRIDNIYNGLQNIDFKDDISNIEDIRFASIVYIKYGEYEKGLKLLKSKGNIQKGIFNKILYARALGEAKQFTEAIVIFKEIINASKDVKEQILALSNLGQLYFSQNLYKESVEQFEKVLLMDQDNVSTMVLLGKSFQKLGFLDRAKGLWAKAYEKNPANMELSDLLNQ